MDKRKSHITSCLSNRLRNEALRSQPEFSESLHQNIVEAIARHRADEAVAARPAATPCRRSLFVGRRSWAVALIAACALFLAIVLNARNANQPNRPAEPQTTAVATTPDMSQLDDWTEYAWNGVRKLTDSASPLPNSDELGQDARVAANVLLRRLPIDAEWAAPAAP